MISIFGFTRYITCIIVCLEVFCSSQHSCNICVINDLLFLKINYFILLLLHRYNFDVRFCDSLRVNS